MPSTTSSDWKFRQVSMRTTKEFAFEGANGGLIQLPAGTHVFVETEFLDPELQDGEKCTVTFGTAFSSGQVYSNAEPVELSLEPNQRRVLPTNQ